MPKKEYGWGKGTPPEIAAHSLAKHRILREYVETYIRVLTANPRIDRFRIALVDGFAGGGEYLGQGSVAHPGSPQILLNAVRAAEAVVNLNRRKPIQIEPRYFFVEKDQTTVKCLQAVLQTRPDWKREAEQVTILEGAFESHIDTLLAKIKTGRVNRTIFVLDQYGYTAVPVPVIDKIFNALPEAEVFLTIAVGWIVAYLPTAQAAAQKLGIDRAVIDRVCLTESFPADGPDRRPDLFAVQRILHHTFTQGAHPRFYTPFFIVSRESNRPYWFLHLANSSKANDVVKQLHWQIQNHFEHFGGPGLAMLGYDPQEDPTVTGQSRFLFDDPAKALTTSALERSLPSRFRTDFTDGVTFSDLFKALSNETPATMPMLAGVVRDLCVEGALSKKGSDEERRAPSTMPKSGDVIRLPTQRSFSFPHAGWPKQ